jgi:hypothetical protein
MLTLTGVSLASCRAQSSAFIAGTDNISVLSTGQKWISPGNGDCFAGTLYVKNTARLKEVVAKHGWPGKSLVGEDGAFAAWLLVQHADADAAFQKQRLELMKPLLEKGEVPAWAPLAKTEN